MNSFRGKWKSAEMWIRQHVPDGFRQIVRALELLKPVELSPETIPQELVDECRIVSSRADILKYLPRHAIVAEVGTLEGHFARKIERITSPKELHLIDINYSRFNSAGLDGSHIKIHKGLSHKVLESFEDAYFHWIYIDADHSYDGVMKDAVTAVPKLKPGGYLIFNDFGHLSPKGGRFGVHRAAVEFSIARRWKWRYLSYHKSALYDLAIQKPAEARFE